MYKKNTVKLYLENRSIYCAIPKRILYHPNLYHSPTKKAYPAMIGIVTDIHNKHIRAIHRTYLNASGHKANI